MSLEIKIRSNLTTNLEPLAKYFYTTIRQYLMWKWHVNNVCTKTNNYLSVLFYRESPTKSINSKWSKAGLPRSSPRDSETDKTGESSWCDVYNCKQQVAITKYTDLSHTWDNHHICIHRLSLSLFVKLSKDKNRFSLVCYLTGTFCQGSYMESPC